MTTFVTKRINNEKVHDFKRKVEKDTRPVRGATLFPELYCNIFLCARKKVGKTLATFKILKKCAGPKTKIVAFCATLHPGEKLKIGRTRKDYHFALIHRLRMMKGMIA